MTAERPHGGNLAQAVRRFGGDVGDWLDLSTGISPLAYPLPEIPARFWRALPEKGDLERLLDAARAAYEVHEANAVVAAPGTQALIQLLPRLATAGPVRVVGPTYNEHRGSFLDQGFADVAEVEDVTALDGAAAAVVVNPNNPDGRRWPPETLATLARRVGLMVVDEAFVDVEPALSLCPRVLGPQTVVLRSFGKFYGLAGLRLGFAIAAPETAARLQRLLGPWAVAGPALHVGQAALADRAWQAAMRTRLAALMRELRAIAEAAGLGIVGGTDLFLTVQCEDAARLHAYLARSRIWVRAYAERPRQLRFGLPSGEAGLRRLEAALGCFRR